MIQTAARWSISWCRWNVLVGNYYEFGGHIRERGTSLYSIEAKREVNGTIQAGYVRLPQCSQAQISDYPWQLMESSD